MRKEIVDPDETRELVKATVDQGGLVVAFARRENAARTLALMRLQKPANGVTYLREMGNGDCVVVTEKKLQFKAEE